MSSWPHFPVVNNKMATIQSIRFTQEQARIAVGLAPEALRHWRKVVPYLAEHTGKSARFTFADLLGLATTNQLVSTLGVSIGSARVAVEAMFRLLAGTRTSTLRDAVIVLTSRGARLFHGDQPMKVEASGPSIIVPCNALIRGMQERLAPGLEGEKQAALPFLPYVLQRVRPNAKRLARARS